METCQPSEEASLNGSLSEYGKRTSTAPDLLKKWLGNCAEGNCFLVLSLCFQGIGHCVQSCIEEMLFSNQNEGYLVSRVKSVILPFSSVISSTHLSEHVHGWGSSLQCSGLSSAPEANPSTQSSAEENQMWTTLAIA